MAADLPRARMPARALRLMGDDRLFRLAAVGDPRAFEAIYERHHQALYRYCRSIVGSAEDAADALQNAMVSALRGLAGERREIPLKPWLFRIAHNECISLLRKRRAHAALDDALELEAPVQDPATRQRLLELMADLRELPDAQRGALVMHEMSGMPYRDIASALDTSEPHARQLVYEARSALHDLAQGRAMECEGVRRMLSDADGRVLRGRRIRAHLRACPDCKGFDALMRTRRRDLAAIAPPLPVALAAGLLHKVLGSAHAGGTSAAAATSGTGGALGSLAVGKTLVAPMALKVAAVVAVSAAAGVGAVEVAHTGHVVGPGSQAAPRVASRDASHRSAPARPARGSVAHSSKRSGATPARSRRSRHATHPRTDSRSAPTLSTTPRAHAPHTRHTPTHTHPVAQHHNRVTPHPVHPIHPVHPTPKPVHSPTHPAPSAGKPPAQTKQKSDTVPAGESGVTEQDGATGSHGKSHG